MSGQTLERPRLAPYLDSVPGGWGVRRIASIMTERRTIVGNSASEFMLLSLTLRGVIARDMVNVQGKLPADFSTYQAVKPGDLVFCLFDVAETPRTVGMSTASGMITGAYTVMRVTAPDAYPRFLEYVYLSYDQRKALRPLYAGMRNTIRTADFRNIVIPFPDFPTQRTIADYLDRETAEIDAFIADQEELIALLTERRAATISSLVTGGMNPRADVKESGVEWIGTLPKHWQVARLGDSVLSARNGLWGDEPFTGDVTVRCVRVADFDRPRHRTHDLDVTQRSYARSEFESRRLARGDLLLEKSGGGPKSPVGFCVRWNQDEDAVCSNFVARLRLADGMDSRYWVAVHAALYSAGLTQRSINQSTGIQNLNQSSYFAERVPVPPSEEQAEIADQIAKASAEIDAAIADAREAIALSRERRAALISAAVTGKIDVTRGAAA